MKKKKKSAVNCGFNFSLISFEELTDGNIVTALRFVKEPENKGFIEAGCLLQINTEICITDF